MEPIDLENPETIETLVNELGSDFSESLRGIVNGTVEDTEGFGRAIVQGTLSLWQIQDEEAREAARQELYAQSRLLVEKQRLCVVAKGWAMVDRNVDLLSRTVFTLLRTAAVAL